MITPGITGPVSKIYDGTSIATLTSNNFNFTGSIFGDDVTLSTPTTGSYANPNVSNGIGVSASGISITSALQGNIPVYGYQLASSTVSSNVGVITPATLTYTANAATRPYGTVNPAFTGTVTGFVNNESLGSATSGTLAFTSPATATSSAGSYGINGSGLTAGNYIFSQAAGNSTALTVSAASVPTPAPTPTPTPTPNPIPTPTATPITFTINNATSIAGDFNPVFTAEYTGPSIHGVDTPAILAGFTYKIVPTGPGTYEITATGKAPAGYTLNIVPATLTITSIPPTTIPSLSNIIGPDLPATLPVSEGESSNLLQPVNSLGLFEINFASTDNPGGFALAGFGLPSSQPSQTPLAQSSFFSGTSAKSSTYAAGAKP